MLHIVNESCPTKIFLSNPNIDRKLYAEIFQLNDTQLELLESLVPKRELLLIQPRGTKKLVLGAPPGSFSSRDVTTNCCPDLWPVTVNMGVFLETENPEIPRENVSGTSGTRRGDTL
jgi:hypothetical protein